MPKGYWIGHMTVDDPGVYAKYRDANAAPFARHGARFLVRGGEQIVKEGEQRPRTVVIEFPSLEAAKACYEDPEYQAAKDIRDTVSRGDLVIIEGYDA